MTELKLTGDSNFSTQQSFKNIQANDYIVFDQDIYRIWIYYLKDIRIIGNQKQNLFIIWTFGWKWFEILGQ